MVLGKGFPAFPAHLRMRPVSRGNSLRVLITTAPHILLLPAGLAPRAAPRTQVSQEGLSTGSHGGGWRDPGPGAIFLRFG